MKKNGQRAAMIGSALYTIEVARVCYLSDTKKTNELFLIGIQIKRDKETRSSSITEKIEEHVAVEHDNDEKNKMLQRINRIGGKSMIHISNPASAFVHPHQFSDDDSINNEFIQHVPTPRSVRKKTDNKQIFLNF